MTFSTLKQKIPSKKSLFWWYPAQNLYEVYVSLRRWILLRKWLTMEVKKIVCYGNTGCHVSPNRMKMWVALHPSLPDLLSIFMVTC